MQGEKNRIAHPKSLPDHGAGLLTRQVCVTGKLRACCGSAKPAVPLAAARGCDLQLDPSAEFYDAISGNVKEPGRA
jgi:hypothetical protein